MNIFFAVMFFSYSGSIDAAYVEDEILSVIYDEDEPIVITKSEVEKAPISGGIRTLERVKRDALISRDARNLKVVIPDETIERSIAQIQKQNNISQDQFLSMLSAEGITIDEYRTDLKTLYVVNSMIDFRVHSRAIVPYESILNYYNQNPLYNDEEYHLGLIQHTHEKDRSIEKIASRLELKPAGYWSNHFWIKRGELAHDKDFINQMHVGMVHGIKQGTVYTFYKLLDKKDKIAIPLKERYESIVTLLKKPLEIALEQDYFKELFDNAIIVDF